MSTVAKPSNAKWGGRPRPRPDPPVGPSSFLGLGLRNAKVASPERRFVWQ